MKSERKKFNEQKRIAALKVINFEKWEELGLLVVRANECEVVINYLIWHIWSNKGLVKLCRSLHFFLKVKYAHETGISKEIGDMKIYVDYGVVPNEYKKTGVLPMVIFNPEKGFKEL